MNIDNLKHPTQESFLIMYEHVAKATPEWLLSSYQTLHSMSEYTLLTTYIARSLASACIQNNTLEEALRWVERALRQLDAKDQLKKAYGADIDYMASVHACMVLKMRCLSLSNEFSNWHKAKELGLQVLENLFPSLYLKHSTSKEGVQIALMLMGVHNRMHEHERAMDLGVRLQKAAQEHQDISNECRGAFNWALASLLLSKRLHIENKNSDADAALGASIHVLKTLMADISLANLFMPLLGCIYDYTQYLQGLMSETLFIEKAQSWDDDILWALSDLITTHQSNKESGIAEFFADRLWIPG